MKNKSIKTTLVALVVATGIFAPLDQKLMAEGLTLQEPTDTAIEQALSDTLKTKLKRGTFFLLGIESKLKNSSQELRMLRSNIRELEKKIDETDVHLDDLTSQLNNLDRLIAVNEEKKQIITRQIALHANSVSILEDEIKMQQTTLEKHVASLDSVLNAYYLQNNLFFDPEDGNPSLLAFLAVDSSSGEVVRENDYLFFLQNASQQLAKKIILTQAALDAKQEEIGRQQEKVATLQTLLMREERTIREAKESKERLLTETKGRQAIYQTLLDLSKKEEEQVSLQIARLKENYDFFKIKLSALEQNPGEFSKEAAASAYQDENPAFDETELTLLKGDATFIWPVPPSLGISAYFRDESYRRALGVVHNAIDIRIAQGSKVKAAGSGVVTKVVDNGFAYSYVIIAHPGNMLTLYGHLSNIFVSEGQLVNEGQVIGLSGGIPGTKGAGWLTTGAHLHFEVFKDWKHVDPLDYLSLEYLPISSLPEKYLKKLTGEEIKIRREK